MIDLIQHFGTAKNETCFMGGIGDNPEPRRSLMRKKKFVRQEQLPEFDPLWY
jgi:hypothetical protein